MAGKKDDGKQGYKWASMNAILYAKIDKIVADRQAAGLPHRSVSDIMNLLALHYLLEIAPDDDLRRIKALVDRKEKTVHKAVQSIIKNEHNPSSAADS